MNRVRRDAINRDTGTRTVVIDNRDGWYISDDLPWYTECDAHSMVCGHYSLDVALNMAAHPSEWCDVCYMIHDARRNADVEAALPDDPRERYATMLALHHDPRGWDEHAIEHARRDVANMSDEAVDRALGFARPIR